MANKYLKIYRSALQILLFILFSFPQILYPQELDLPINFQSPTASSLGQSTIFPISHYTGSANINIPLETFKIKDIALPVSINYNSTGIRVDSHTGPVGQNWSLEASGVITRTVHGWEDERGNQAGGSIYSFNNNYFRAFGMINNYGLSVRSELIKLALDRAYLNFDPEPDIFTFNFMGYSGKFFMGSDGKWKVISPDNLKIEFDPSDMSNYQENLFEDFPGGLNNRKFDYTIQGFKVIDSEGTSFVFGYDEDAVEYSIPFFNQVAYSPSNSTYFPENWIANSWYLSKVIDKFGDIVYSFDYSRGFYIAEFSRSEGQRVIESTYCSSTSAIIDDISGSLISPVYLQSITAQNNSFVIATFNYEDIQNEIKYNFSDMASTNARLWAAYAEQYPSGGGLPPYYYLQSENLPFVYPEPLSNRLENPLIGLKWKKLVSVNFNYNKNAKYQFRYNDVATERLCLLGLDKYDYNWPSGTFQKISHEFSYQSFSELPGYLSKKVDHWGFYNGNPYDVNNQSLFYAQRNSNSNFSNKGSLEYIYYPTGGFVKFEFEPNTYSKIGSDDNSPCFFENGQAGGLRVRKITTNDGANESSLEYKYVKNYNLFHNSNDRSGILRKKPRYFWGDWLQLTGEGWDAEIINDENIYYGESVFSVNSLIPLVTGMESHIGYSEIAEISSDGGYTIYKYTDLEEYRDQNCYSSLDQQTSPYDPQSDLSNLRGKLKEISVFNSNDKLLSKTVNEFPTFDPLKPVKDISFSFTSNAKFGYNCKGDEHKYFRGNVTKIYFFDFNSTKKSIHKYFNDSDVETTKLFSYANYWVNNGNFTFLKSESTSNSNGGFLETRYTYPMDIVYNNNCIQEKESCNNLAIAEKNKRDLGCYGYASCLGESLELYKQDTTNCGEEFIQCIDYISNNNSVGYAQVLNKMLEKNMLSLPVEEQHILHSNSTEFLLEGTVHKYRLQSDNSVVLDQILKSRLQAPSNTFTSAYLDLNSLLKIDNNYQPYLICDLYDQNHNLAQYHYIDGTPITMNWGYNGLYPISETKNATFKECDYLGFENMEYGNWQKTSSWSIENNQNEAKTGRNYAKVQGFGPAKYFDIQNLAENHGGYKASVWVKGGEDAYIHLQVKDDYSLSRRTYNTKPGEWNLVEVELPMVLFHDIINSSFQIKLYCGSSSISYFDELRFFPIDAQMTTCTYSPFLGTTSVSDINNKPNIYEYDEFGRLMLVRDFQGDILKKIVYHLKPNQ